jgi:hypothetical protein
MIDTGQMIDTGHVIDAGRPEPPPPVWRVPVNPLPPDLAKRSAQVLAMTDVETPHGRSYRIHIRPQPPGRRDPLPAVTDAAGMVLPALVAVAVSALGRRLNVGVVRPGDRWAIEVIRRETRWRDEKVVHEEIIDAPGQLIDRAFELADLVQRGVPRLQW